ncbi:MAG: P-loop NTPase fold protein [Bacteroidales bacterium]|nr:P-loop NTPase fold protein [Bacteroidales bacterium]
MANNNKYINTLKRPPKSDRILLFLFILLSFIYAEASESIYIWLNKQEKDFWMNVIYSFINNKPLINIFICIAIVYLTFLWARKIWQDKDIRLYRTPIAVFGIVILNYKSDIYYANIICNFSYQCFLTIILSSILAIILIKLIREIYRIWKINKQNKEPELKGFSVDNTEIKLEDNQIKYAETLVKKLKNTDLSKESFAVGITGEWGSGKSTFLNTMKEKIEEAKFAEFVEFNPWLCNSPEQITQDFFATLINKLSPKHSTLSRDINKYAKLLNKIAKASLSIFGIDLDLTPSDDSLNKLKDKISNKLAKLPKKVVILIDDTDRLEGNEVFEILRLIRNTADFKNVIYIATYDKEYVTDVLEGNKIKDPDNYLEKIFQVEVHLLKTRDYLLWSRLVSELNEYFQFDGIDIINSVEEQNLVLKVLTNYRQIKRFARHYITYSDYLNNIKLKDIDKKCLFWIELLQMYDKYAYDILAKDYTRLLNDNDDQRLLHLKDKKNISKLKLKDETLNILNIIFPEEYKTDIQLKANYDKYFSLSIAPFEVSMIEYITAISYNGEDKMNNAKETISKWSGKKDDSIIARFINSTQYLNNTNLSKNYISLILYFALIWNNFNKIKSLLEKKEIGQYSSERISKIIEEWFKLEINNYKSNEKLIRLSELLNQMYHYYTINSEGYILENPKYFIDNEKIEELLLLIMQKLIDNNNIDDINFSKIYRNCIAVNEELKYIPGERINIEYKQLPKFRRIFDNFSNQNKTPLIKDGRYPTFAEFKVEYNNMLKEIKNK